MNPYQNGLIPNDIYYSKLTVTGQVSAIMNAHLNNRRLKLIVEPTRTFKKYDQVEIIATTEKGRPGDEVNSIAYIAFIEIENGGLVRVGDNFLINNQFIGNVLGFDATHTPNHYNLIINVNELKSGYELKLSLNDKVEFVYK